MANSTTQFGGFLTNVGVALQANSAALGLPWSITHMLIGDAGGEPSQTPDPTPNPAQSALVRRVYRAPLNALYKSPVDPNVLVAELVLPPEIGGWWIRELGLEDADGNFIAVAKPPPSYKPLLQQGSGRTQTIRMHVVFGNVANINLKIDPSIVLATRDYVDKAREAAELYARNQLKAHAEAADPHPQYLRRADVAKDAGPLAWLGAAAGTADALVLTLKSSEAALPAYAAGQRFQFQAVATNTGAVTAKINGRAAVAVKKASSGGLVDLTAGDLRAGALYDLNYDGAYFQLGGGVSGGRAFERFSFEASVGQKEFSAPHTVGSLIVMRNGREVTDYVADGQKVTLTTPCAVGESVELLAFGSFRAADTYTKAELLELLKTASALPVGAMLPFPKGTVPAGFLEVDGSEKHIASYPDLAAYLGGAYNNGNEQPGYFRLPDSRGEFLRGWSHGRDVDAGRALGSVQLDAFQGFTPAGSIAYSKNDPARFKDLRGVPFYNGAGGTTPAISLDWDATAAAIDSWSLTGGFIVSDDVHGTPRVASETRPRNLAVMWCIKAWNAPVNQGQIDVAALAAQVSEIAAGVPVNYVSGLILSMNAAVPTASVDLSVGVARGAVGAAVVSNTVMSGMLQAAGAWSAGAGGNKLDSGARAASTFYHCFVLRRVADGLADFLLSSSVDAPLVPAGYSLVSRLKGRAVKTDAAGLIVPFINYGRSTDFKTLQRDMRITGGTTRSTAVTVSVPPGVSVVTRHYAAVVAENGVILVRSPDADDAVLAGLSNNSSNTYAGGIGTGNTGLNSENVAGYCESRTNAAGQVVAQVFISSSYSLIEAWLYTQGWTEE
ncbi:phage tail-collar fiber domain-containing protein [Pseudomonas sichuanensis]|uniref:phage tail-collar fiber domain-containing protein n=1 Tax=Pseudomonas sichuanensis TaxID=2213015 RepID=UPI0036E0B8E0